MKCEKCIHEDLCIMCAHHNDDTYAELGIKFNPEECKSFIDRKEIKEATWLKYGNKRTCENCEYTYWSHGNEFNYCPNCGADMKGCVIK